MRRATAPTARILDLLMQNPTGWVHGYAIMKTAGLGSSTLYPSLERLRRDGLVTSRTNTDENRTEYQITGTGERVHAQLKQTKPAWWFLPVLT
jgi:DNA-binding PadR family transcriptional regulator